MTQFLKIYIAIAYLRYIYLYIYTNISEQNLQNVKYLAGKIDVFS